MTTHVKVSLPKDQGFVVLSVENSINVFGIKTKLFEHARKKGQLLTEIDDYVLAHPVTGPLQDENTLLYP
jgi:hypothetical protein